MRIEPHQNDSIKSQFLGDLGFYSTARNNKAGKIIQTKLRNLFNAFSMVYIGDLDNRLYISKDGKELYIVENTAELGHAKKINGCGEAIIKSLKQALQEVGYEIAIKEGVVVQKETPKPA